MVYPSDNSPKDLPMIGETSPIIEPERLKRRTFAIISHPDAGKTTLTEKLLLYSGMVRTAGVVRGRKGSKAASSDWMAMEQERGISITASAMQFPYKNTLVNVLDTPGHQDFSEDTYRTLTAADCAIMVIDASKGVEAQTRKLFQVCRLRQIPILTFINKLDLPARDPFELLQELEELLGINTSPRNWPIGSGRDFKGVVNLVDQKILLFERGAPGGAKRVEATTLSLDELLADPDFPPQLKSNVTDDLELLEGAGNPFNLEQFLAGEQTPVFFGSALTNFGVEEFFDRFIELGPPPRPYSVYDEDQNTHRLDPSCGQFTGFVFKIQANMNPKHRDSMAFIRVCSGKFERDMSVEHRPSVTRPGARSNKTIRLSRSYTMKANERDTIDDAFAGDIVGVINPGSFSIGDTIVGAPESKSSRLPFFCFPPLPQFPPEVVGQIRAKDVMKTKAFQKGIMHLCSEGAVQLLRSYKNPDSAPYVAAVGQLQFEVLQHRLEKEYNVNTTLDQLPYCFSAYAEIKPTEGQEKMDRKQTERALASLTLSQGATLALDQSDRAVLLYSSQWQKRYIEEQNPNLVLIDFLQVAT